LLHQVGVYYDVFRHVGGALKLAERRCVYDNLLVPNALCIPVYADGADRLVRPPQKQ
jgi:anthranilate 1,2-dioxygenase small subunit